MSPFCFQDAELSAKDLREAVRGASGLLLDRLGQCLPLERRQTMYTEEEAMAAMFSPKVELVSTIHLDPGAIVEISGEEYQLVWDGLEDKWILRPSL